MMLVIKKPSIKIIITIHIIKFNLFTAIVDPKHKLTKTIKKSHSLSALENSNFLHVLILNVVIGKVGSCALCTVQLGFDNEPQ